jgi:FMN phosphatase YigB (HAD superfamily)
MRERKQVYALDFDGVICDSLEECLLTSWHTYYNNPIDTFTKNTTDEIPREFRQHFRNCRSYVRHNGHFLVPLLFRKKNFNTQKIFDDIYVEINSELIKIFNNRFLSYRNGVRTKYQEAWLSHHILYEGIAETICHPSNPLYIVTAKDTPSVELILHRNGIHLDNNHIYGEQTDKNKAFSDICRRESVEPEQLHFIDDNLINVTKALKDGYSAQWANWGYNTTEHQKLAIELKVDSIEIEQLSELLL